MVDPDDLIEDSESASAQGHNSLAYLEGLVQLHQEVSSEVADLEDQTKVKKAELQRIKQNTLPDAMMQVGLTSFKTQDGIEVSVDPIVAGSIPKDNRAAAHEWLRKNGDGDLIRANVVVSFTKEQHAEADALFERLTAEGYTVTREESVHPATLCSWAKKALEEGRQLPLTLLGLFYGRVAKMKVPKKSRKTGDQHG